MKNEIAQGLENIRRKMLQEIQEEFQTTSHIPLYYDREKTQKIIVGAVIDRMNNINDTTDVFKSVKQAEDTARKAYDLILRQPSFNFLRSPQIGKPADKIINMEADKALYGKNMIALIETAREAGQFEINQGTVNSEKRIGRKPAKIDPRKASAGKTRTS